MRISDWSSDVCSSDLAAAAALTGSAISKSSSWTVIEIFLHNVTTFGSSRSDAWHPSSTRRRTSSGRWRAREAYAPDCAAQGKRWQDSGGAAPNRSEEHTSELQSLMRISYAVFCLKKNKTK